jgi:cytochrome d ubiquinol oxidase subunit I
VHQHYLLQARQMQALSLAVHIPLVCFGISFPALVLFAEWRYLRTGDELYRTLARRWTRVMAALFAVGVVTGTILSFELGLLWPSFMATFGGVFGLGFAIEGFSFFMEAIFIGIYIYGWDRLSPRAHLASGIPIALAGFTGSLMVISVNGWMNHPSGFRLEHGKAVDVHPFQALFENSYLWHELIHMYLAAYMVTGFLLAAAYAWSRLRGRFGRYERTALAVALAAATLASVAQAFVGDWNGRTVAAGQPTKLAAFEGLGRTTSGAPVHLLGWYSHGHVEYGIPLPRLLSLLAFHSTHATVRGLDAVRSTRGRHRRSKGRRSPDASVRPAARVRPRRPCPLYGARGRRLRRRLLAARRRPGRARQAGPRPRPSCNGAGVGSEPRLAGVRPHRRLDRLPRRVRFDRLHLLDPALPRRDRDHPARGHLHPSRRRHGHPS